MALSPPLPVDFSLDFRLCPLGQVGPALLLLLVLLLLLIRLDLLPFGALLLLLLLLPLDRLLQLFGVVENLLPVGAVKGFFPGHLVPAGLVALSELLLLQRVLEQRLLRLLPLRLRRVLRRGAGALHVELQLLELQLPFINFLLIRRRCSAAPPVSFVLPLLALEDLPLSIHRRLGVLRVELLALPKLPLIRSLLLHLGFDALAVPELASRALRLSRVYEVLRGHHLRKLVEEATAARRVCRRHAACSFVLFLSRRETRGQPY
mmetsp:Transcript_13869/g.35793  ORF Transcript_13869/g.35793 Transcript_13869/m.35793 type:complete len:263 (-) Transcript_13869:145-933(-)